jgi:hypothetical protein
MVETLIRCDWRRVDPVTGTDLGGEDQGSTEPDVHAWLSLLSRANNFSAEHAFEPLGRSFRIGRTQMNVIPLEVWHLSFSVLAVKA